MATIPQTADLQARLHQLQMQRAKYGISADPHIPIEIERIDNVLTQFNLIEIHRRNASLLIKQRAQYDHDVPLHILNALNQARQSIASIKQLLKTKYNESVNHLDGIDYDLPETHVPVTPKASLTNQEIIDQKLMRIERLIAEIRDLL